MPKKRRSGDCRGPNLSYWETYLEQVYLTHRGCGGRMGHPLRKRNLTEADMFRGDLGLAAGQPHCLDCGAVLGRRAFQLAQREIDAGLFCRDIEVYQEGLDTRRLWAFYRRTEVSEEPCDSEPPDDGEQDSPDPAEIGGSAWLNKVVADATKRRMKQKLELKRSRRKRVYQRVPGTKFVDLVISPRPKPKGLRKRVARED